MTSLENSAKTTMPIEVARQMVDCFNQSVRDLVLAVSMENKDASAYAFSIVKAFSDRILSDERASKMLTHFDMVQCATAIDLMKKTFADKQRAHDREDDHYDHPLYLFFASSSIF